MTTTLTTYRAALEHIRDGSDAVCTECGWMGKDMTIYTGPGATRQTCPACGGVLVKGHRHMAAYALAQGDEV